MNRILVFSVALIALPSVGRGQAIAARDLGPPLATSMPFTGQPLPSQLVELPNGSVFFIWRSRDMQVLLLNSTLTKSTPVRTDSDEVFRYGNRGGVLVRWRGDSTFFTDAANLSSVYFDRDGIVRASKAVLRPSDQGLQSPAGGKAPVTDGRGAVIYANPPTFRPAPDSAFKTDSIVLHRNPQAIVRLNLDTRRLDTLVMIVASVTPQRRVDGRVQSLDNPIPVGDGWVVLSDGTVAVVHGTMLTLIDSARAPHSVQLSGAPERTLSVADRTRIIDSAVNAQTASPTTVFGVTNMSARPRNYPPAAFLPDRPSAFQSNATYADQSGRIWLKRVTDPPGVYSIFSQEGTLVSTVRIPTGSMLLHLGQQGVYLAVQDRARQSFQIVRFAVP